MLAEAITSATTNRSDILAALHQASDVTGSDFGYLLSTATRESGLKNQAQATTSSAAGLFQFVEQTWLGMIKQHGAKYGLSSYANAIQQTADGRYQAASPADRSAILALRSDPKVSALMEGEYANATKSSLEGTLGRSVCNGELYAAHFLGPDAACRLIQLSNSQPQLSAADAFPKAASANKNVFYHRDGTAKTVREVYDWALKQPLGDKITASVKSANAPAKAAQKPFAMSGTDVLPDNWMAYELASSLGVSDINLASMAGLPRQPMALTSSVLNVLASLSPDGRKSDKPN
ncbi:MAG: lytic transglycosylase domain-containing protein [Proteobacteria bacterium]|nr:lytic transglycosylase domain-containing protein [Pseudomonadota bacterium]